MFLFRAFVEVARRYSREYSTPTLPVLELGCCLNSGICIRNVFVSYAASKLYLRVLAAAR